MVHVLRWWVYLALGLNVMQVADQNEQHKEDTVDAATWVITPRLNTAGHFPFTGSLINKHLNVDLNIFFEQHNYGFFIFKSHDLEDGHSIINYLQPGVFRKFRVSEGVDVRLFVGYLFSQTQGFRDKDSDYYTAAVAYWTLSEKLKLEYTALFFDLEQNAKLANRLLASWQIRNFRIDFFIWHRTVFKPESHAISSSVAINFPRIRLANGFYVQNTFSYQSYVARAKPDFARREGFLFSLSFPLHLNEE